MKLMNRRAFIRNTMASTAATLAGSRLLAQSTQTSKTSWPEPCLPSSWTKHGIVLQATEPWEGGQIQNFTSPVEPLDKQGFRIWYSGRADKGHFTIAFAEGKPGNPFKKTLAQCSAGDPPNAPLAIGHLPGDWKPTQVVHIHMRNGKHRLYFWAHGPGILRFLAADSDDGRHYRVIDPHRPVLYHPSDRAARGIPSPDGAVLNNKTKVSRPANEPPAVSHLISNDSTFVYQLPNGTFEMYSVALVPVSRTDPAYMGHDNAAGFVRVIDNYRSEDGITFRDRHRVIQKDDNDPPDMQFYHLSVTYTDWGRVGMLGHYRVEAQTMDLEWCISRDGRTWNRPRRSAWLPRGDQTQPDSYAIYPPAGLVNHGGQWHLFYTATNSAHNHKHSYGPPRTVVMHATTPSIWA